MMKRPVHAIAVGLAAFAATALLSGCNGYDRGSYDSPTDPGRQYLSLSVAGGASTLPADGISSLQITAAIAPDSQQRTVEVTTTAGTLVGGTGSATDQMVTVDSGGRATLSLRSSQTPGPVVVTARVQTVPVVAQSLQLTFTPPDAEAVLRFVSVPATAPADGATASLITVAVSPQLGSANRTVAFSTTAGSFSPGSTVSTANVTAGADLTATTVLYSPTAIGAAVVTATVANSSRQAEIHFERANPDLVTLQLSDITVTDSAASKITATATLQRTVGAVTPGTPVTFEAIRLDTGAPFGLFTGNPAVSSSTGTASATFSPAGSGYRGLARITASAGSRSASLDFQVTAP